MIISQTPLRVSFFGGGTDLPSFYTEETGCVISTAIQKYVYIITHESFDGKYKVSYSQIEKKENPNEIEHRRVREAIKITNVTTPIEIHSIGEVPSGTGLGTSSSYTVGILHLLYAYKGIFASKNKLANEACEIEIDRLKEPIGKQDQFAAAYGGMNFIQFNKDGTVNIEPILATQETLKRLNKRLVAFYLNQTRDASSVLMEQNENVISDKEKRETMKQMKQIAIEMKEELNNNRIERFGEMLHKSWNLKRSLASKISNDSINNIYQRGIQAGATGGKVLGAGGGGFIMFYCEPEKQESLRKEMRDLKEFKFEFENEGSKIIYTK